MPQPGRTPAHSLCVEFRHGTRPAAILGMLRVGDELVRVNAVVGRATADRVQMDLTRSTALESGRNPDALEYTRWGSIDMTRERVEAFATQGVTRIVVGATATEPDQQRDEMSAFAQRFGLLNHLPR
jgi:hypothetical protein